jgi:excisionase family DNA binding protein
VESTPSRAEARTIARLRNELVRAEQLVVRPAEAERLLDISHKTLYRLMNSGELQSFVVGRSRRIPMASIRAYIEARLEKFPKSKPRRASG